jgi:hypothetical protein
MRIAEFRESSDLWTQMAPEGYPSGMSVSVSERFHTYLNVIDLLENRSFIVSILSIVSHERCASGSFGPMKWSHHSHVISLEAPNYPHPRGSTALLTLVLPSIPCIWDRQDHPLNLSISLSGGKEINEDCLSSGERSGKSPSLKSGVFHLRIVI